MRHGWVLALALMFFAEGTAHTQTITGVVTDDASGLPLVAANITLQPGGEGTSADRSGRFSLSATAGRYTLRITHVGYGAFERIVDLDASGLSIVATLHAVPMPGPEIEVSAIRARARVSPVTFSELRQSDLRDSYFMQDVPVVLSSLPSSTFYSDGGSGIGYTYLRIRGFDQRRLAVMVNGVPQNDPEDHNVYWIDFADLLGSTQEIQVQRGAGSAFYGPPAIGGSINLVTGDFANEKGVRISTGGGSYNTQRYALAIGSGLVDGTWTLFGRLSRMTTDGYRDNAWTHTNSYYVSATRYDASLTTRITVYGGPLSDGLVYYGLPKFAIKNRTLRRQNFSYWEANDSAYTYTQPRRPEEQEEFAQPHYELLNEWKVGNALTLNSTLFYVVGQGYFDYDATGWTNAAYFRLTPEFGFPNASDPVDPIIRAYVDNRQWGWLPRMTLSHAGGTMTAGLELRSHHSLHWGRIQWAEGLPQTLNPDRHYYEYRGAKLMTSAYVQEMVQVSDRVNVMGNVQAVYNRYRLYDEAWIGTDFSVPYVFINPRLGANWNIDDRWNLYANLSYTQREPRLNNLYDAAESSGGAVPQFAFTNGRYDYSHPLVTPERLLNLELGTGFTTEHASILLNGYAMEFTDEIVKSGQLDRFGQPITGNADRTRHLGIEVSAHVTPLANLELDANGMLSRSRLVKYSTYENDPVTGAAVRVSLDGNRIAGFPEALANARVTWRQSGFTASLSLKYVGDQYTDNTQNEKLKVDPFAVFDAVLGYRVPAFFGFRGADIRLAVNNLTDALYAQSGEGNQFFVGAERNWYFDIAIDL